MSFCWSSVQSLVPRPSDELKKIVDQFEKQGKMRFLEAATEEQIEKFETDNELQLPSKSIFNFLIPGCNIANK